MDGVTFRCTTPTHRTPHEDDYHSPDYNGQMVPTTGVNAFIIADLSVSPYSVEVMHTHIPVHVPCTLSLNLRTELLLIIITPMVSQSNYCEKGEGQNDASYD